jgi:hypothetical protein
VRDVRMSDISKSWGRLIAGYGNGHLYRGSSLRRSDSSIALQVHCPPSATKIAVLE